ncbi:oncoprotein-induced transcript 3 protein-like [Watersipora subatra]|uniref:oncoprotein-induced transcript 3 protein-like n=1 Tax=Watersipora subatra TaxID=2589382 RepID=UPI00355B76A0
MFKVKQLVKLMLLCALVRQMVSKNAETNLTDIYESYDKDLMVDLINSEDTPYVMHSARIQILHRLLQKDCKTEQLQRVKRALFAEVKETKLFVEKVLYEQMVRMLIDCRQSTTYPTSVHGTTQQPSTTTQLSTSTIEAVPQPLACQSARNLTEAWRMDHEGREMYPNNSPNCDQGSLNRIWFRFIEEAGTRMLNKCPPLKSCGSHVAMWTDSEHPTEVGVESSGMAYGSWNTGCKTSSWTTSLKIMKCSSEPSDFIYKSMNNYGCSMSFCGM